MFTKAVLISAIAGLGAAAPAPVAVARDTTNTFGVTASHSGSVIQNSAIVASGNAFYIGKASSAYCPSEVSGLDCTAYGNSTFFAYNPDSSTLGLDVAVPGGQNVYVASTGALGYTVAHSGAIPNDSYTSPFQFTPQSTDGTVGSLTFEDQSFYACPVEGETGVYQIFAAAITGTRADCIGLAAATSATYGAIAWQF